MSRSIYLAALCAGLALPAAASAGGLSRPNGISARSVGNGGAFTAIADDPTALHFNPAGAAWADATVMIGAEVIDAPRSYTPIGGSAQEAKPIAPAPTLGVLFRTHDDDVPSRLTFGVGLWNSFGGALEYDRMAAGQSAVNSTTEFVFELAAGAAYEVNDMLSLGAAVRLGLGLFAVNATAHPLDSNLSATGVGAGATLGVMFRPTPAVSIGVAWRSPLVIQTHGSGTITGVAGELDTDHEQPWPQQASLGVAVRVAPALRLAAQLDWTDWSRWQIIQIHFPEQASLNQNLPLDWSDSYAVRAGADYTVNPRIVVRAGAYYDTAAVPDRTIERIYLDNDKLGVSAGTSLQLGTAWRLDLAADFLLPNSRDVPSNGADVGAWGTRANMFPGEHRGYILTAELAAARRF